MSTPAQIIAVIAVIALAAEVTYRLFRHRTDARQLTTLLAAAHEARHDRLSGSGSRYAFHEAMGNRGRQWPVAVILINLDATRSLVGRLGDRAFDQFLVLIAGRINHLTCTVGGPSFRLRRDEFAVIVEHPADAADLAARFVSTIAVPTEIHLDGHPLALTVSACAGVTIFSHHGGDARLALTQADRAMRSAKRAGRGQVAVFEPAMVRHRSGVPYQAPGPGGGEGGVTR
jgi:diguanylate cyclase (GGDEF)-like protein